ncbi:Hypothetical protein MPV1_15 [Marinitoga phage MPV1]|uniref:Uncharacterized protein n=1 Tax=Marinitoga piezophila (strain DSM 14283 / JCM 11233 / KA3) TaxID=443254 RepID=H2J437_MARPK|nr:hypothetical protein [Marinitoga piezophila]AEX84765.1 hypothetical protein Marpi_0314 [Marinitoga piezophila KA3]
MKKYNFFNSRHLKQIYIEELEEAQSLLKVLNSKNPILTDELDNLVQLSNIHDVIIHVEFKADTKILKEGKKKPAII